MPAWREGEGKRTEPGSVCVRMCVHVCVMRVWRVSDTEKGGRENRAWECVSVCVRVCVRAQRENDREGEREQILGVCVWLYDCVTMCKRLVCVCVCV